MCITRIYLKRRIFLLRRNGVGYLAYAVRCEDGHIIQHTKMLPFHKRAHLQIFDTRKMVTHHLCSHLCHLTFSFCLTHLLSELIVTGCCWSIWNGNHLRQFANKKAVHLNILFVNSVNWMCRKGYFVCDVPFVSLNFWLKLKRKSSIASGSTVWASKWNTKVKRHDNRTQWSQQKQGIDKRKQEVCYINESHLGNGGTYLSAKSYILLKLLP